MVGVRDRDAIRLLAPHPLTSLWKEKLALLCAALSVAQ